MNTARRILFTTLDAGDCSAFGGKQVVTNDCRRAWAKEGCLSARSRNYA